MARTEELRFFYAALKATHRAALQFAPPTPCSDLHWKRRLPHCTAPGADNETAQPPSPYDVSQAFGLSERIERLFKKRSAGIEMAVSCERSLRTCKHRS